MSFFSIFCCFDFWGLAALEDYTIPRGINNSPWKELFKCKSTNLETIAPTNFFIRLWHSEPQLTALIIPWPILLLTLLQGFIVVKTATKLFPWSFPLPLCSAHHLDILLWILMVQTQPFVLGPVSKTNYLFVAIISWSLSFPIPK
jgi:hypothetical protein